MILVQWFFPARKKSSWNELSSTLEKSFVLDCLKRALNNRKPEIINSDQGDHFTNPDYIELLEEAEVKISMDGNVKIRSDLYQ